MESYKLILLHLFEFRNNVLSWDNIAAKVIPTSICPKAKDNTINLEYFISIGNWAKISPTFVIFPEL